MNVSRTFIDTNVLVYAFTADEPAKQKTALTILDNCFPVVSTQVIKEFAHVLLNKAKNIHESLHFAIQDIITVADVLPETTAHILNALTVCKRYGYSFYDSLIIAAALEANCQTLLSEDMQDNQVIDGRLIIRNPFAMH
ncbi:MAG: PIN domain-containing protein [Defluviitaleaceae bacterium]|nr:PIN domain-containing protein [Defluviitaleaceae bacterium]